MGCQQELAGEEAVPWICPLWFIHFLTVGKSSFGSRNVVPLWQHPCVLLPLSSAVLPGCGCGAELQWDALRGPAARPRAAAWPGPDHQGELGQAWGLPKNPSVP